MLTVHQLAKSFDLHTLFHNVSFSINRGERIGLIGPNGCGKTTLLRILAGVETADSGHLQAAPGLRIGYLPQGFELDPRQTVGEITARAAGHPEALEAEIAAAALALSERPSDSALQAHYDALLQRISTAVPGRAAAILAGLGLEDLPQELPVGRLSGGQKTRLALALTLLNEPHLLLLDEPTNHLDIGMLEWLETWLAGFEGGALIVSHDRTFLDRTVTGILAFDPLQPLIRAYPGNYSAYAAQTTAEWEQQWAAYHDQQQEIRRIKADIQRTRHQAEGMERAATSVRRGGEKMKMKGYKDYQQGIAKKVAAKAKAREGKLERYLDSAERVEKPGRQRDLRLDFSGTVHLGRFVLETRDLSVGYTAGRPLLSDLNLTLSADARVVLSGPNGCGKTTLLRTIAGQLPSLAGTVALGPSVRLGYMAQEQDNLDPGGTPLSSVRGAFSSETAARQFLGYFLISGDEALLENGRLSYGQRARLSLAQLVAGGCNLLLLDEPINHLDIRSREQFEEALDGFDGAILAVVHDRTFTERFAEGVWWVEDGAIVRK
jgi:ATP-binding cassette subfamily F protein 3